MTAVSTTSPIPFISVVVPTYARPRQITACLEAFTGIDYPTGRWELIVVDDGSPEALEAVAAPFLARLPLLLLRQGNQGPAAARNTGVACAQGEYIAFTDDDCAPAPDWLRRLAAIWAETPDDGVGGHTINTLITNPYSSASQALIDYLYEYFNGTAGGTAGGTARFFASNNLAFPVAGFRALGGFDARYRRAAGEDRGLCDRWIAQGHRLHYAPDAIIYHAHHLSLRSFWRQHLHYGSGAYHFHRLRFENTEEPDTPRLEPVRFYADMVQYPFRRQQPPGGASRAALSTLMALSQVATAIGYFWEKAYYRRTTSRHTSTDKERRFPSS